MSTDKSSSPSPSGQRSQRVDAFIRAVMYNVGLPALAIVAFLCVWSVVASHIKVSLGDLPGPVAVVEQAKVLYQSHMDERQKEHDFYKRQDEHNAKKLAEDPNAKVTVRKYSGHPTFLDQIFTSLETVFTGFVFASLIAVPLGVLCGLSKAVNTALNPFIQLFKPVSPLAWLPIVMLMVNALYTAQDPWFEKSFLSSAIVVALCSLWPTLINTALGVSSIDQDFLNVAKVLRLSWFATVWKVILPAALPLIFTGLRLSLGVGWMVLIAAEMLAQNPGLGKFVWDMFQNGSSQTLAQIMVAVFVIGLVGFALDRIMLSLQRAVSFGAQAR